MDKVRASLPRGTPIEIWFQDEARIGQKNKITRRWAKRGTRPSAPQDQRTASAYIFGAICPQEGKAAGLVLPFCNTGTMNLHLAEIALHVAPGAHAVLRMDQAGWHLTPKLEVPANISIVAIPSTSPELNPQENVWQFMRDNWLSNRVFGSYDEIADNCCHACNKLVEQPSRIMSIGLRAWACGLGSMNLGIRDDFALCGELAHSAISLFSKLFQWLDAQCSSPRHAAAHRIFVVPISPISSVGPKGLAFEDTV